MGRIPWPWFKYLEKWRPAAQAAEVALQAKAVAAGAGTVIDPEGAKSVLREIEQEFYRER